MPPPSRGSLGGGWGPRSSEGIGPHPHPHPPLEGEGACFAEERCVNNQASIISRLRLPRNGRTLLPRKILGHLETLLLQCAEQFMPRLPERRDALGLELLSDCIEVNAEALERFQIALGEIRIGLERAAYFPVIEKSIQRFGRQRVHCIGTDKLLDVQDIPVAWILSTGARPQWALRTCAALDLFGDFRLR